jgi:hypothetical protein
MEYKTGQLIRSTVISAVGTFALENPSNIYRIIKDFETDGVTEIRLEKVLSSDSSYLLLKPYIGDKFTLNESGKILYKAYKSKLISNLKKAKEK